LAIQCIWEYCLAEKQIKIEHLQLGQNNQRALCQRLAYHFSDESLLNTALSHKSYTLDNNERLEFLGDSVLNFAVTDYVYRSYANMPEGELTRMRARLVCKESLFELAQQLHLGDYLLLGEGESKSGGRQRSSILADAMEALFGAIYLDAGYDVVRQIIIDLYGDKLQQQPVGEALKDAKSRLQEWTQKQSLPLPQYDLVVTSGEGHARHFVVSCQAAGMSSEGEGSSRRRAEQASAADLLLRLPDDG